MIRLNETRGDDGLSHDGTASEGASRPPVYSEDAERDLPEPPLIDVNDFAALLSCSVKHVRRMADAGRCPPPIRLGTLQRWNRKVVDDWIAAGCPQVRLVRVSRRK